MDMLEQIVKVFIKYQLIVVEEMDADETLIQQLYEKLNENAYIHHEIGPEELDREIHSIIQLYKGQQMVGA